MTPSPTAPSSPSSSTRPGREAAVDLCRFVDASPSPYHACEQIAVALDAAGFTRVAETDAWPDGLGRAYVLRDGSLIAWSTEAARGPATPFRIVGGHTDSPNLRLKQHVDTSGAGWRTVLLEPYGGPWTATWMDRDLGLAGRVAVRDPGAASGASTRLVHVDRPVLRVPNLAIHLSEDRTGVRPNPQWDLNAVWGFGDPAAVGFLAALAAEIGVRADDLLGWELMTVDTAPSGLIGIEDDLVSAPRLDNLATCFAGHRAFVEAVEGVEGLEALGGDDAGVAPVLAVFNHEEVGSTSNQGAFSDLLATTLERVVLARGGGREDFLRACAGSILASADMAHATHPNHPERHEPHHWITPGGGPVLKVNQKLNYATDAVGAAVFALACEQAGVPMQRYIHRADLPCGSTIGPMISARTGITTVDVGAPQLAMHSCRELMAADDVQTYIAALRAFLTPAA